jgi:uncharacterized protein YecE (DUF72 family)
MTSLHIGTAGWSIPREMAAPLSPQASGLQRYATRFGAVEINTSFYRSHRAQTYARWARDTPAGFRFAVKAPRTITHDARLVGCEALLDAFIAETGMLGEKLGPLLVQLPPSLAFDQAVCERFFGALRDRFAGAVVCEPRHESWFDAAPETALRSHRIARAAVDPAPHPLAATPGGWAAWTYWRLHGSPRIYYSPYGEEALTALAARLAARSDAETWCVFDNTALGAAVENAARFRVLAEG